MTKLTNQELYDYIMLKLDKHATGYFTEEWVSQYFNESYVEWVNLAAKEFEKSSKRRADLINLVKRAPVPATKIVSYSAMTPAPYLILRVEADYNFVCKGVTTARRRRVKPIPIDAAKYGDDPYNASTEYFPCYEEFSGGTGKEIHILTKTTPLVVEVMYIKSPDSVDMAGSPNSLTEIDYPQQIEVVDIVVRKLLQTLESPELTAQAQLEIPKNE